MAKLQSHPKLEHNKDAVKLFLCYQYYFTQMHKFCITEISLIIILNPAKIMTSDISLTLTEPFNTT